MKIRGEKMKEPQHIKNWKGETNVFTIAGGAVSSINEDAYFGYYECRFKAAKTTMSTTFWLSSRRAYDGPKPGKDRYTLELDIQECIGREGNFKGSYFASGMNSNTHFWYTDEEGEKHDLRSEKASFESDKLASEDFNVYGGWWRDESTVSFYFNDGEPKTIKFNDSIKEKPFDQPMGLNMVSETYPFPWIELPNDEELADPEKNTCYYDWVRVYTLVDVDAPPSTDKATVMFDEMVKVDKIEDGLPNAMRFNFAVTYMANEEREIFVQLLDSSSRELISKLYPAIGGYGRKLVELFVEKKPAVGSKCTVRVFIRPKGSQDNSKAFSRHELDFIVR